MLRLPRARSIAALLGVLSAACTSASSEPLAKPKPLPDVRNPSGDCVAPPGNGARPGHGPGGTRYLPDCNAPLRRQYYRVFASSERDAAMVPRPDDAPATQLICTGEPADSALRALFEKYTLCAETPNVERINAMTPVDALAIAHALHERMRFVADRGFVRPYAFSDDVLAVCAARADLAKGVLAERCKREREQEAQEGPVRGIFFEPPDSEGPPLAAALNELYGIAP